jgi:hypothetical protein
MIFNQNGVGMQKTLTSNLKVTTIWPELTNHRILGLDSKLEEIGFENRGASLLVGGIIHRKVICFNERNQCRKVEDRLQFTTHLALLSKSAALAESASPMKTALPIEEAPPITSIPSMKTPPSRKAAPPMGADPEQLGNLRLSDVELIQNDFVFQPRPGGSGPAVLEQNFTLVIRCPPVQPVLRRKTLPAWSKLVIESGQGKVVLDLPVGMLGPSRVPRNFNGSIQIQSPVHSPAIHGILKGAITYCSREKELKELDFETEINFLMEHAPQVKNNQQLWISGELIASRWREANPNGVSKRGWRLEIKLHYQWRLIEERELWIVAGEEREGLYREAVENYVISTPLKKFDFQLLREYALADWGFEPGEIKVRLEECWERLTPMGIMMSGKLCFEALGIDSAGQERFQTQLASFEELAPLTGICLQGEAPVSAPAAPPEQPLGRLQTHLEPAVELASKGFQKGIQRLEVLLKFQVSLFREQIVSIPPIKNIGVPILACLIGERQEFTIEGEGTLMLQVRPRQIIKLEVRPLEASPMVNEGWIGIDGRMEVAVGFVDERFRYYETTFTPFFQGAFNWDKLQPHDTVKVQCRLNYYSYTWEGSKVFLRYWLQLVMENRRETEIMVETVTPPMKREMAHSEGVNLEGRNPKDSKQWDSEVNSVIPQEGNFRRIGRLGLDPQKEDWIHSAETRRLIIAGEIPLKTGTAQEMGSSRLSLSGVHLQRLKVGLIIEGILGGTIEYWDPAGFLQRETVELSFWRLSQLHSSRKTSEFLWNQENLQLELLNVSITPSIPPTRGKSKVRVWFELKVYSK